jgi:hypothetical protein
VKFGNDVARREAELASPAGLTSDEARKGRSAQIHAPTVPAFAQIGPVPPFVAEIRAAKPRDIASDTSKK